MEQASALYLAIGSCCNTKQTSDASYHCITNLRPCTSCLQDTKDWTKGIIQAEKKLSIALCLKTSLLLSSVVEDVL